MSFTAVFHPLTRQDYNEAYSWYEEKQKGLGERFLKAIRQKIEQITGNPYAYGTKDNKKFREARVNFFPYVIVYKVDKSAGLIYVSSIHHTRKRTLKKYRKT